MSSTIYLGGAESSPLINKNFKKMCMKCFLNLYALIDEKCFKKIRGHFAFPLRYSSYSFCEKGE